MTRNMLQTRSAPKLEPLGRISNRDLLIAFVGYSALTMIMTWPVILNLTSALPHDAEDPLLSATILWWNAHVLPLTQRWVDGFFFYPAGGALALSDHRLGLSPIASPLLWLGVSPITTYNIVWLATYPLCAVAAHGLGFALTRRHDAAIVCALAFGFNPFRVEHLSHLELLAAFGMPAALWALHRFDETRRPRWLAAFTVALIVQGLCASYYLLFFLVFVALWVLWFARDWRIVAAIGAACFVCAIALSPVAVEYARVHRQFDLSRRFGEIVLYSADVTSLVTAPALVGSWGWTAPLNGNETRIFPGLTIMILAALGIVASLRRPSPGRASRASVLCLVAACFFGIVALVTAVHGPWQMRVGPIAASGRDVFKTLSLAAAMLAASAALSARGRDAYRRRSPFAFYLLAAIFLYLCALGPNPLFLGHRVLYEPPYAWLMRLPLFDHAVRVPARFAMPAALALSVTASLAFSRLTSAGSRRTAAVLAVVAAGIVADAWVPRLPVGAVPDVWSPARAQGVAAVLELPLGGTGEDVSAMYRTVFHHRPTINGYSGYSPPHYDALRAALTNRDDTALDALASGGPLLLVADKDKGGDWPAFVRNYRSATPVGEEGHWAFFSLPRNTSAPVPCESDALPIAAASDNRGTVALATITDANKFTWWTSEHPQQVGDRLMLDLGRAAMPCAVVLWQDGFAPFYPHALSVATSLDGTAWTTAFSGKTGGLAIRGALASPVRPQLAIPLPASAARFISLRVEQAREKDPWVVTDIAVRGRP
jgi:hypothetical protein